VKGDIGDRRPIVPHPSGPFERQAAGSHGIQLLRMTCRSGSFPSGCRPARHGLAEIITASSGGTGGILIRPSRRWWNCLPRRLRPPRGGIVWGHVRGDPEHGNDACVAEEEQQRHGERPPQVAFHPEDSKYDGKEEQPIEMRSPVEIRFLHTIVRESLWRTRPIEDSTPWDATRQRTSQDRRVGGLR
jgi:hypothetical protein